MAKKAGNIIKTDATRPKAIITDADYRTWIRDIASRDLRAELGVNEGLSETTLKYAKYFYELYAPLFPNRQQVVDDFDLLFQIPWSHHVNMVNDLLTTPIGIADYQVTTQELPEELQGYLPTYQELEHVLTQNAPHIPEEDNQDMRNLN